MARKDSLRYSVALLALLGAATIILWLTRGWFAIGVPHFDPLREPFSDAYVVLWGPEVCAQAHGEWVQGVCFVPSLAAEAHAQAYEPWLTFFRWGLGSDHTLLVATLVIGMFYLAAALAFTTMLKLYTGLACTMAWAFARRPSVPIFVAAIGSTVVAVSVLGLDTLSALNHGAPEGAVRYSTGAHWLFRQRGMAAGSSAVVLTVAVTGACASLLAKVPTPRFAAWPNRTAAFNLAFLVAIPLFFLKDSYDYRMVLWLPCLSLPLALMRGGVDIRWRALAMASLALFLVTAGVELPCVLLDTWSLATKAEWTAPVVSALVYVKQLAAWLLVGALGLIFGFEVAQRHALRQPQPT